jgi:hypothetical protein
MSTEFYQKLVDLYASHELPLALEEEMEIAAMADPELAFEMRSLRETVDALKEAEQPEFDAEISERILMTTLMRQYGAQPLDADANDARHYQYQLPIKG